jgi:GTPase Era involved in 16S rRNA processing
MKKFVAIVGRANSGKSTIIGSLTGCKNHSTTNPVVDQTTQQKIFVIPSSPEEKELTWVDTESSPERTLNFDGILDKVIRDPFYLGIVMAIQPTYRGTRLRMEEILTKIRDTGAFSTFAIILDPPYTTPGVSHTNETNKVSISLKNLGVGKIMVLNGGRFAHLNACEIQRMVGLPEALF